MTYRGQSSCRVCHSGVRWRWGDVTATLPNNFKMVSLSWSYNPNVLVSIKIHSSFDNILVSVGAILATSPARNSIMEKDKATVF